MASAPAAVEAGAAFVALLPAALLAALCVLSYSAAAQTNAPADAGEGGSSAGRTHPGAEAESHCYADI